MRTWRSAVLSALARFPRCFRLAVNVDLMVLERRREHEFLAFELRSQAEREFDRWRVGFVDAVDDVIPAETVERPIDRGDCAFVGQALPCGAALHAPADFVAGPIAFLAARTPRT